jgi:hypothetical protein
MGHKRVLQRHALHLGRSWLCHFLSLSDSACMLESRNGKVGPATLLLARDDSYSDYYCCNEVTVHVLATHNAAAVEGQLAYST